MVNTEYHKEHIEKIRLGDMAKEGKQSAFWLEIVKPILDSMIKGLVDIRDIRKSLLVSNKKAEVEILGRGLAAEYFDRVEGLIDAFVDDSEASKSLLDKMAKGNDLYKEL